MKKNLTLDGLNAASRGDFIAELADVVENSSWIAEATEPQRPFARLVNLRDAMLGVMVQAPADQRIRLIRAHPDLANKTQRAAGLTEASTSEQDGAGLDRLSDREFEMFEQLNGAYNVKFGFPFILCVRRHTKDSILDTFAKRLRHSPADEEKAAITEIGRIATLRLAGLVTSSVLLSVHGELSMHVLDTHSGTPAEGVEFELVELARYGVNRSLLKAVTNSDGRTASALISGRPVPIGSYELRFQIADYYSRREINLASPLFFDVVPIRFEVSDPEGHYHVPLLMTPWSYTTYRGS